MKRTGWMLLLASAALVTGCGDREEILPGQREELRAALDGGDQSGAAGEIINREVAISLPAQKTNASWTHSIGTPAYRVSHATLSATPQLAWSARIGSGDSRRSRITADPVVADGRVFTMDSGAQVAATSTNGAPLWVRNLTPEREKEGQAHGGGLAVSDGTLFVSSGYGLLTALDSVSGEIKWQQKLEATGSGAPTVYGDLVYLVAGDDTGWAIDKNSGRVRWQVTGTPDVGNVLGASAPALNDQFAVFAFGGGEVQGTFRKGGLRMWEATVPGERRYRALANVTDITGAPVIQGDRVYVGSHSGRLLALRTANGERIWTAREGALNPVWPVGNSVFLISDINQLVRLDSETGEPIWAIDLPGFVKDRPRKQSRTHAHHGPILAGGRLVVASSDGVLRMFDPVSGALNASIEIPGGATTAPVVAGGVLYVVSKKGELHAFR